MRIRLPKSVSSLLIMLATIPAAVQAEEATWVGYYTAEDAMCEFGTGMKESYDCAIYLPGNVGFASGKKVEGIRFAVQGVKDISSMKVWVSTRLPEEAEKADLCVVDVAKENLKEGEFGEVLLDRSIMVPDGGMYVGYSLDSSEPFPVLASVGSTAVPNGFFIKSTKTYKEWKDLSSFKNGNLALQVLVDGKLYVNAAQVGPIGEVVAYSGSDADMPVTITNYGNGVLYSLEYQVYVDGVATETAAYQFPQPLEQMMSKGVIPVKIRRQDAPGAYCVDVSVTKVNGEDNEFAEGCKGSGTLVAIEEGVDRNVVMEEFTGTWCGWCPRGMVALEHLNEDFGSRFIGIAVHQNDPMTIGDYEPILSGIASFPHGRVDRTLDGDPFFGSTHGIGNEPSYGIRDDIENELEKLTAAKISVESEWLGDSSLEFDVKSSMTLAYDRKDNPDYRVAYVVVADSLCGDTPSWFQNNDFALPIAQGYKDDPYLGWLTDEGQMIRGLKYNDVAIAAYEVENGYPLESDGGWRRGEEKEIGSLRIDLTDNRLVQDRENISIVALLLNPVSGEIVNGAKAKVGGSSSVKGIDADSNETVVAGIYSLNGMRRDCLMKGINIVRYTDGSVRKILCNK